jgi:hypothetical protein
VPSSPTSPARPAPRGALDQIHLMAVDDLIDDVAGHATGLVRPIGGAGFSIG